MMQTALFVLQHYAIVLIFGLVLFGAGRQLLRRLDFGSALEEIAFSTGLGLGLFGTLIFVLGLARLLYLQAVVALLVVMVVASLQTWRSTARRLRIAWRELKIPSGFRLLLMILICGIGCFILWPVLVKPFYPPHQWDAISYHLAVAKSYASSHAVEALPHLRFCVFPQLMNMLFAAMLLLQDDIAAQLVSFLAMILTALSILGWGARRFSFTAGVVAAALLLGSPMILLLGSSAYIDMGLTMFVTLAILAYFNWRESGHSTWLVLSGAMIGFAAGVKYTGAFLALAFLVVLLAQTWKQRRWRLVGGFVLTILLTAGPWYARNVAYTNDPFFPMLGRTVPNPCWDAADAELQANDLVRHGPERTFVSFVRLPWDLTFNQKNFVQDLGTSSAKAIFVLLPLAIWFAVINPLGRQLMLVVLAYTIFWFLFAPLIRYLQPIVPLWSLVTAAALAHLIPKMRISRTAVVLLGLAICISVLWNASGREMPRYHPVPVTDVQRDIFLSRFSTYPCYDWLNRHQGEDYRVYSLGDEYMAYFADGVRLGDHMGPGRYRDLDLSSARGLHHSLRRLRIDYFMTPELERLAAVRADPQFPRHFSLVCGNAYAMVWRLTENGAESQRGGNVLVNPGLEDVRESSPFAWGKVGEPLLDVSGGESRDGKVAFRADRLNYLFPTVTLPGDQLYEIRFWARAEDSPAEVRLEFHWQKDDGTSLGAYTQLFQAGVEWTELILPLTTPVNTSRVVLYPHTSDAPVWFDAFSVRPILNPESGVSPANSGIQSGLRPDVLPVTRRERVEGGEIFTITAVDPDGAADVAWLEVMLNESFRKKDSCLLRWSGGAVSLLNDDGIGIVGSVLPGSESTIENARCRIDGAGLTVRTEGNSFSVDVPITIKKGAGPIRAYGRAQDQSGHTFFWEPLSEWVDPAIPDAR